jgi:hypothetical protein
LGSQLDYIYIFGGEIHAWKLRLKLKIKMNRKIEGKKY